MKKRSHRIRRILITILTAAAVLICGFLVWTSFYYRADASASAVLREDMTIERSGHSYLLPEDSDTAMIFYPGAKVETIAYLPILEQIRSECGINVFLTEMPLHLAILDVNAANSVIASHPEIHHWIMSGHSMGGAMASDYASHHSDQIEKLILMGAYRYGSYPADQTLILYGSLNSDLESHFGPEDQIVRIEGGNHAQFGNYGKQKGDAEATISAEDQQRQAVAAIASFLGVSGSAKAN